mmetsp:Transcript_8991/g.22266  ORF Transcript_8991/g.22266 Transcript_8991/m.22266 type:complete len:250 (-) Transcript_8991:1672-2421(-)
MGCPDERTDAVSGTGSQQGEHHRTKDPLSCHDHRRSRAVYSDAVGCRLALPGGDAQHEGSAQSGSDALLVPDGSDATGSRLQTEHRGSPPRYYAKGIRFHAPGQRPAGLAFRRSVPGNCPGIQKGRPRPARGPPSPHLFELFPFWGVLFHRLPDEARTQDRQGFESLWPHQLQGDWQGIHFLSDSHRHAAGWRKRYGRFWHQGRGNVELVQQSPRFGPLPAEAPRLEPSGNHCPDQLSAMRLHDLGTPR